MSATVVYGRDAITGRIEHIEDVDKAAGRSYLCCGCGISLTVVKSQLRKKDWHFRHGDTANIASCRSTALHDFAVQLIVDNNLITVSKKLSISYDKPRKEVVVFNRRSDATVICDDADVHFEVVVTHDLDQEKIDLYNQNKIRCFKIDLSDTSLLTAAPDMIRDIVLDSSDNKIKIYWPDELARQPSSESKSLGYYIGLIVIGAVTAIMVFRTFFKKKRRTRRR